MFQEFLHKGSLGAKPFLGTKQEKSHNVHPSVLFLDIFLTCRQGYRTFQSGAVSCF